MGKEALLSCVIGVRARSLTIGLPVLEDLYLAGGEGHRGGYFHVGAGEDVAASGSYGEDLGGAVHLYFYFFISAIHHYDYLLVA